MKEHVQDYGVRKWAGDDLIELQSEPLSALQALVAPYASCILQGCELETVPDGNGDGSPAYRLHAGYVALKGRKTVENGAGTDTDGTDAGADGTDTGSDGAETAAGEEYVKIVRVEAQTVHQPTVFLTLACTPVSRAYGNGENKAIAYDYTAEVCDVLSEVGDRPYLALAADADNPRLPDTLGVTKKLNSVDGEAKDVVVNFAEVTAETDSVPNRPELKSGSTLGLLMRQIRKWFDELKDLKALAFKEKVAKTDLDADLQGELDGKVVQEKGKGLSEANFTPTEKLKLDGIANGANNYVHPTHASKSSGLYKIAVDGSGHVSSATAVTKSDITTLGIPGQDTTYSVATTYSDGLMSSTDKSKLNGIAYNANNYSLPLASSSVRGGVKIGYTQSGKNYPVQLSSEKMYVNVPWTDTVYTHPTSSGYKHIPSGGSSGQYLKYSSSGTAMWANLPYHISTVQSVGTSATLYPGRIVLITSDIIFKTGSTDMDTLKHNNVTYASNSGWKNVKIAKNSGVHTIFSRAANDRNGITNNSGLWIFTWVNTNVIYVDFVEESTRYDA